MLASDIIIIVLIAILGIMLACIILAKILRNPFFFPYLTVRIDVFGKRNAGLM